MSMISKIQFFLHKYIWLTIKFYVTYSPLELRYTKPYFSQFGEDVVIGQLLKKGKGFYVDVGAYHPISFSNTYLLYRKGWSGINIEPNPKGFSLLQKFRTRDINLNLAVSESQGKISMLNSTTMSRIIEPDQIETKSDIFTAETLPLRTILEEHVVDGTKIDLLSIDCEGHDLAVLKSNDWRKYRPDVVVVEDFDKSENTDIDQELNRHGYKLHCKMALSKIYTKNNH